MPLQHAVLFRFPRSLSCTEEEELRSIIGTWPSQIGTMTRLRFGKDMALVGDRAQGYQFLLMMEFSDVATFIDYRAHPSHQALSMFIKERDCVVLAFDYELVASTLVLEE